jgi:surfeit locus 1 family protein
MDHAPYQQQHGPQRGGAGKQLLKRLFFLVIVLLWAVGFAALGVWQVERRAWKLDLIAKVDARVHAPPAVLPLSAGPDDSYRRVRATGRFDHRAETLVQAVTERGPGFWVMTPLHTDRGVVLINRGFVPDALRDPARRMAGQVDGEVEVTGLLRLTEPGGGFLRRNDPAGGHWYSRDVGAIAAARHLGSVLPFFVDADAHANSGGYPVGGLTVVRFRNAHLVYALTWFALSGLCLWAGALLLRRRKAP